LIYLKEISVETNKVDRYGREIGKVIHNGADVCLEQVKRGMAWWYRDYQYEQTPEDRVLYEDAEDAATAARLGLWTDKEPVPPWAYRREKRD
jgi:endonuclease YncB( thermonuclease family)